MSSSNFLVPVVFSSMSYCEIFFFSPMQTHFNWLPSTRVAVLFKLHSSFSQVKLFLFVCITVHYMQDCMKFCYLEVIYLYKACEEVLPFLKHLVYLFLYDGHVL